MLNQQADQRNMQKVLEEAQTKTKTFKGSDFPRYHQKLLGKHEYSIDSFGTRGQLFRKEDS